MLRQGGNAVDAAVAAAAAVGVTEPYSAGIGGGGYFVYYDARSRRVHTLDGRETAPQGIESDAFVDPETGKPRPFADLVTSGLSVGVPGTPATWERAVQRWGRKSLGDNLLPAIRLAERGFVVDKTFASQTETNRERFAQITPTAALFLPKGAPPAVGSTFRNLDLADTYRRIARGGAEVMYSGKIAAAIVDAVQNPPRAPGATLPVPAGSLTLDDLEDYRVLNRRPTRVRYRGLDVYGMAPSSSGGTTVGEALNILERFDLRRSSRVQALHYYLDASALAFADRNAYVGDPAFVRVPTRRLLSQRFANSRACLIPKRNALPTPAPAGDLSARGCRGTAGTQRADTRKVHQSPVDVGPLGQRRVLHADHRADRRLRHRRARPWFPAQQRVDGLQLRPRHRPEHDRAGQAAAVLDGADDRAAQRPTLPGGRLAGWFDDHHHGAADPGQPHRPGPDPAAGGGGAAGIEPQHRNQDPSPAPPSP